MDVEAPRVGLEHSKKLPGETQFSSTGGAESGALGDEIDPIDSDLAALIEAWPTMPEGVRAGIVAMIRAATGGHRTVADGKGMADNG